ncbi:MAG: ABC-ATPase domain-containing protein [Lachnospiraceae bacterium]|nr:ABC-ATPase domain-containing protein [Lachnospiraceae bacterium]
MTRLKSLLMSMENKTKNWREMYEGLIFIPACTPGNPTEFPVTGSDPTYWSGGDVSFTVETTNRMAFDRPTILCQIPAEMLEITDYSTAVADDCYRQFIPYLEDLNAELYNRNKPPEETGYYYMAHPTGEILVRNSAYFTMRPRKDYKNLGGYKIINYPDEELGAPQMCLSMRFQVQLKPNDKKKAVQLLVGNLPNIAALFIKYFDNERSNKVGELYKKQKGLRNWLKGSGYCAFLANGSILPRDSKTGGAMEGAIPFIAPADEEIEVCGIKGLGIRKGVTVITGGGYSGKSTVLDTISAGIYDHILGDGRELCVTDISAMTISAEDGRSVKNLDISPFISWLPGGDTEHFSTYHASGSTSQAANILEAMDAGAKLLLIDEDKSATNFMIRDALMKELIRREPITPFTERVNELHETCDVSTILVIGGSGEYLAIADNVYLMDEYLISNVTEKAREIYKKSIRNNTAVEEASIPKVKDWYQHRIISTDGFSPYPKQFGREKLEVPDIGFIIIGEEKINANFVHDIVCNEQRTAIGFMLRLLETKEGGGLFSEPEHETVDIVQKTDELYREIEEKDIDMVYSGNFPDCDRFLAYPRKVDFMAVVNRMRHVNFLNHS